MPRAHSRTLRLSKCMLKVARQVKIMLYSLIDLSALSADRAELEGRMDKPVHRTRCEPQEWQAHPRSF